MADWVTGKALLKVQNWTDARMNPHRSRPLCIRLPPGNSLNLALKLTEVERVQRAYSYVNSPDNPDLEFYLVTVPDGKLSPRLAALKPP